MVLRTSAIRAADVLLTWRRVSAFVGFALASLLSKSALRPLWCLRVCELGAGRTLAVCGRVDVAVGEVGVCIVGGVK